MHSIILICECSIRVYHYKVTSNKECRSELSSTLKYYYAGIFDAGLPLSLRLEIIPSNLMAYWDHSSPWCNYTVVISWNSSSLVRCALRIALLNSIVVNTKLKQTTQSHITYAKCCHEYSVSSPHIKFTINIKGKWNMDYRHLHFCCQSLSNNTIAPYLAHAT